MMLQTAQGMVGVEVMEVEAVDEVISLLRMSTVAMAILA
jgi:hypothetical protein